MADTVNNVNVELIKFRRKVSTTFLRKSRFDRYMGSSPNNIIVRVTDLAGDGKQINVPLVDQLRSDGVATSALVGAEEQIDNYGMPLWADWARNATTWLKSTAKESSISIREVATPSLDRWTKRIRRDDMVDTLLSIPTAVIPANYHVGAGARVNGLKWKDATAGNRNSWLTANNDRVVFGHLLSNTVAGNVASSLANVGSAADKMTAATGLLLKRQAQQTTALASWPAISPYMVEEDDQEWFVCFLGSRPMRDLAADPAMYNANKDARERESNPTKSNPIFTGSHLVKDGIIYREIPEIDTRYIIGTGTPAAPNGPLAGVGASSVDVSPVLMCGASAFAYVIGQMPRPTQRKEDDYDFRTGVGIEMQFGYGKVAKAPTGQAGTIGNLKDWGVVTGFVASPPDA
jgi:hypothetical protein